MVPFRPLQFSSTSSSRVLQPSHVNLSPLTAGVRRMKCRHLALEHGRNGNSGIWHCRFASSGDAEAAQNERILALEAEIFDFMENSLKPGSFPTKEELIAARRMDLVEAIVDHGGWLAYGWDLEELVDFEGSGDENQSDGLAVEEEEEEEEAQRYLNRLEKERRLSLPDVDARLSASKDDYEDKDSDGRASSNLDGHELANDIANQSRDASGNLLGIDGKNVLTDLQRLESELTSVLGSLGSLMNRSVNTEDRSVELGALSDELEFKETETANVQEKLRSMRAKLTALEGKMMLRTAEAAAILREKQCRIDAAKRALSVLARAYVTWPGIASEVFLAGSFDGWTTQRKMEKSSSGVFSLLLRLYPGQYEIKFIVDGVWRVDPLRPMVGPYGFENNLLIVS